jgi:nodulation protein E
MRRVVVTGMGAISAAGVGAKALWNAARDGRSCVSELALKATHRGRIRHAAQVVGFDPAQHVEPEILLFCDIVTSYLIVAADEAVHAAGLSRSEPFGDRTATIIGTGIGGIRSMEIDFHEVVVKGKLPDALSIPRYIASAGPTTLSMRYQARGPCFAVASACASSTQAIGMGAHMIRAGMIERAIVGGGEDCLCSLPMLGWEALRVLSSSSCRPFSNDRDGTVLGSGAGVFVLESLDTALQRGAPILAEIAGYGTSSDAKDPIRPDVQGAAAAIRNALTDANLGVDSIDYINAHGTATRINDVIETAALQRVFGERLKNIPVSSTKPVHGHGLGACGALELAITIASLCEGVIPPTINWTAPDPQCAIDAVPNEARKANIQTALSNSFAFGGINAVLAVRRAQFT